MNNINKQLLIGKSPNSKLLKQYKDSLICLSNNQWREAPSIGLILGDASLRTQNHGKTYKLQAAKRRSDKHKPYLSHVYNLFDE
jgi:hypothetical protein